MSPSTEANTRLVARRIKDGFAAGESAREIAEAVMIMIAPSVETLAPAVAAIVAAAEEGKAVEVLERAANELRKHAQLRFEVSGPSDPRGAALWDAGCHLDPADGDAFKVGVRKEQEG